MHVHVSSVSIHTYSYDMLYFEVLESSLLISFAEILRLGHHTYTFHGDTLFIFTTIICKRLCRVLRYKPLQIYETSSQNVMRSNRILWRISTSRSYNIPIYYEVYLLPSIYLLSPSFFLPSRLKQQVPKTYIALIVSRIVLDCFQKTNEPFYSLCEMHYYHTRSFIKETSDRIVIVSVY